MQVPRKDHQAPLGNEAGRRRSKRVLLSIPISVRGLTSSGTAFQEDSRTLVVNAHGALIALAARVTANQLITVVNKSTNESRPCRVIYLGNAQADKTQMGVEFVDPSPSFWQVDFPPDDWVNPES